MSHPEASIARKCTDLIALLNVHLNHFPKHERYALQQRIRDAAYDVFGLIVECQKKYHNKTSLTKLDIRHEQLRMFVNLGFELGYYKYEDGKRQRTQTEELRRYTAVSVLINELGAMIGGWIRSLKTADGVGAQHV
jgi:hypothetical protein